MNLFILDKNLVTSASYHFDSHVNKMILEAAQLMCGAHWVSEALGFVPRALTKDELKACREVVTPEFYKLTHANHPCAIWVRSSLENFLWTKQYAHALAIEKMYRFGTSTHKSIDVINRLPIPRFESLGLTPYAQAMPEQYRCDDAVKAYRNYYKREKQHLYKWKYRDVPGWITGEIT